MFHGLAPIALGLILAITADAKSLRIERTRQLPCFTQDERLGYRPKPGCAADADTAWSSTVHYTFNKIGLRERDVEEEPASDKIRVLLLGPALEGVGLSDEQLPARQVEKKFKDLGVQNVEVLSGAIAGYGAGRYAMISAELARRLKPDVVIYFQTGDNFAFDLIEDSQILRDEYNERLRFTGLSVDAAESSWPDRWREAVVRAKIFWQLYREANSEAEERKKILKPTWKAFEEIASRFGPSTRFLVAWAPKTAHNSRVIEGLGFGLDFIAQLMIPKIRVPGGALNRELRRTSYTPLLVGREFNAPVKNGLAPKQNPRVLTAKGAEFWAESIVLGLNEEISLLGMGEATSKHRAQILRRRQNEKKTKGPLEKAKAKARNMKRKN